MNDSISLTHEMMEANKIKKGCGKKYTDRRGENICGQKDWWAIDLCPECQAKVNALCESDAK